MGIENVSWVCILGACPFAILGFVTYNGLTAEKFILVLFKYLIMPKKLVFKSKLFYKELLFDKNK